MQKVAKKHKITPSANKMILGAAGIYLILTMCLYYPHLKYFAKDDYLFLMTSLFGALGCFVLSRRWISSFLGSLLSGAVYGFCPFSLSFCAYHSIAALPMAAIPWLFCMAAFFHRKTFKKKSLFDSAGTIVLTLLPFLAIAIFFWVCAQPWWIRGPFFPIPKSQQLTLSHLSGIILPLKTEPVFSFAFYHVPLIMIVMGTFIYAAARRFSILLIVGLGFALAFFDTFTEVSPVIWGIIPILFCSILAGLGTQGLAWAGKADKNWILLAAIISLFMAGLTWICRSDSGICMLANSMYMVCMAILVVIYFIARSSVRWHILRWVMLSIALSTDIILGAIYCFDNIRC